MMVDEYGRPEPPREGGEVATLLGFLDYQRATLEWKCRGLSDEQLRVALRPSSMTLGGLLKHLACVEDSWFTEVVAGEPALEPWASADFEADPGVDLAQRSVRLRHLPAGAVDAGGQPVPRRRAGSAQQG
jgi:hypothetical protein